MKTSTVLLTFLFFFSTSSIRSVNFAKELDRQPASKSSFLSSLKAVVRTGSAEGKWINHRVFEETFNLQAFGVKSSSKKADILISNGRKEHGFISSVSLEHVKPTYFSDSKSTLEFSIISFQDLSWKQISKIEKMIKDSCPFIESYGTSRGLDRSLLSYGPGKLRMIKPSVRISAQLDLSEVSEKQLVKLYKTFQDIGEHGFDSSANRVMDSF